MVSTKGQRVFLLPQKYIFILIDQILEDALCQLKDVFVFFFYREVGKAFCTDQRIISCHYLLFSHKFSISDIR